MIELLEHSSNCIDSHNCSIPDDCRQMKGLIYHYLECSNINANVIRCKINCELCKEIQSLVNQHTQSCCRDACSVITCMTYKQYCRDTSDKYVKLSSRYDSLNTFYKLTDRFKKGGNNNDSTTTSSSSSLDSRTTTSSPSMGKAYRGRYNCSKCKQQKMRGHVCPTIDIGIQQMGTAAYPHDGIMPTREEAAMSPATVLFNALQGIHKPKARTLPHSTSHLLPIINHSDTISCSLNPSYVAPPPPSSPPSHSLSITEPGVPFSHMSSALVVVSPSRPRSQKRKLSKATVNDDINDQDDQALDDGNDDMVIHHHKDLINTSTHRPCDKLSYSTSEVDDNDDDDDDDEDNDEDLRGTTSMMKKSIPSPMDHDSQSSHCEVRAAEPTMMFDDIPICWDDDDDLGYLFLFKEGDDAIC